MSCVRGRLEDYYHQWCKSVGFKCIHIRFAYDADSSGTDPSCEYTALLGYLGHHFNTVCFRLTQLRIGSSQTGKKYLYLCIKPLSVKNLNRFSP